MLREERKTELYIMFKRHKKSGEQSKNKEQGQ